ncbi:uncharacterized protein N7482_005820 [Penicillium canariense]|uniref:Uncharacterized protein n=1 Tax=Penicillium canariense TaxID=189055 RepID=A0A9W9I322_9EURO|nr:uncharacterized protein N7482_005820 [Penicillium canariense]KAJ5167039.1 hypothetical protein N7482_005820 [Penicillium canariense]
MDPMSQCCVGAVNITQVMGSNKDPSRGSGAEHRVGYPSRAAPHPLGAPPWTTWLPECLSKDQPPSYMQELLPALGRQNALPLTANCQLPIANWVAFTWLLDRLSGLKSPSLMSKERLEL